MGEGAAQATKAVPGAAERTSVPRRAIAPAGFSRRVFSEPGKAAERSAGSRSARAVSRRARPLHASDDRVLREGILAGDRVHPDIVAEVGASRGSGRPLERRTREHLEPRIGESLEDVRVHTDARAAALARAVSARAFTVGSDVFFAAGEYRPDSSGGQALIAHEATHAVQQRGVPVDGRLVLSDPGDALELEAGAVAGAVRADGGSAHSYQGWKIPSAFRQAPPRLLRFPVAGSTQPSAEVAGTAAMPGEQDSETPNADAAMPMGAEPRVTEDIDSSSEVGTTATPGVLQRQPSDAGSAAGTVVADPATAAGAAAAAACARLTWAQFPPANPPGPFDAQTGYTWSNRGGRITVRFDARNSWVRPKWRRDTSAASMALLRHEQYHLTLACELAGKANAAIDAGTPLRTVTAQFRTTLGAQESSYETDTNHGLVAAMQAAWERDIDAGVPSFPVP